MTAHDDDSRHTPAWLREAPVRVGVQWVKVYEVFARASNGLEAPHPDSPRLLPDALADQRSMLLSQGLVALYSGFEALVRDTLILWLTNTPAAWQSKRIGEMRVPLSAWMGKDTHAQASYVITELWKASGNTDRRPLSRFEWLFEQFGIEKLVSTESFQLVENEQQLPRLITELWAMRNVIVHNLGVVDADFCAACPHLSYHVGQPLMVVAEDFERYSKAALAYMLQVVGRLSAAYGRVMGHF